jgi:SAM-dependent methyltransferase
VWQDGVQRPQRSAKGSDEGSQATLLRQGRELREVPSRLPPEVLPFLEGECGLTDRWVVADIGSGTGILSELFLGNGNRVFGVEPNAEMRRAAERLLGGDARFTSVAGSAEATTLAEGSVDLVAAGQAFHWFDPEAARAEFLRVLKPGGWVALAWNARRRSGTPFLEDYERLLLISAEITKR